MTKLRDIASAVRSANAGASLRTFDIMFDRPEDFRRVVEAEAVSPSVVARLYAVPVDEAKASSSTNPPTPSKSPSPATSWPATPTTPTSTANNNTPPSSKSTSPNPTLREALSVGAIHESPSLRPLLVEIFG